MTVPAIGDRPVAVIGDVHSGTLKRVLCPHTLNVRGRSKFLSICVGIGGTSAERS
jgi:hypothetical protein